MKLTIVDAKGTPHSKDFSSGGLTALMLMFFGSMVGFDEDVELIFRSKDPARIKTLMKLVVDEE